MLNVFVYGTLRTGHGNHRLVESFVKASKPGTIQGDLFCTAYGLPIVTPGAGTVHGEWLQFDDQHVRPVLKILDDLEGFRLYSLGTSSYWRVPVQDQKRKRTHGYMYVWPWAIDTREFTTVPSGDYDKYMRVESLKYLEELDTGGYGWNKAIEDLYITNDSEDDVPSDPMDILSISDPTAQDLIKGFLG